MHDENLRNTISTRAAAGVRSQPAGNAMKRLHPPPRLATPGIVFAAIALWTATAIALAAAAEWLCPEGVCGAPEFDRAVLAAMAASRHPALDEFWTAVTHLGSILVLLPCALVVAWRLRRRALESSAMFVLASLAGAFVIAHAAKALTARPRPDLHAAIVSLPPDMSFPSAHTLQAAAFVLALLLMPGVRRGVVAWTAGLFMIALVATSRLYLQVHFVTDVLFAALAAFGWVLGLRLIFSRWPLVRQSK